MIENDRYILKKLIWDTNFFEINSAELVLKKQIFNKDIKEIKRLVNQEKYKFITIRNINNNENNNKIIPKLGDTFLADINIQYEKNLLKKQTEKIKNIIIENNMKENLDIINISKNTFIHSRFNIDKNLEQGKEVHTYWVKNAFNKKDKYFCYYLLDNQIKGYILFSKNKEKSIIYIELIAIKSGYRNKGIGTKLISELENLAINEKIHYIDVGTQINNKKAQNFYINNKFKIKSNNSIYHWWEKDI